MQFPQDDVKQRQPMNIEAQYQPVFPGQMPQGQYAGQYAVGVPVGQPMQTGGYGYVQQPYPAYGQNIYGAPNQIIAHGVPGQQMVVVQVVQQVSDIVLLEERIRNAAKWFNGCNTVWGVFALINLLSRSIALFDSGSDADQAAGVIIIIENVVWIISIGIGIYGMSRFNQIYLLYYQYGLFLVIIFEVISSIIIFSSFSDQSIVLLIYHYYFKGAQTLYVIFFLITVICIISFIHNARQLRQAIIIWQQLKAQQQMGNQNQNQIPVQNHNPYQ